LKIWGEFSPLDARRESLKKKIEGGSFSGKQYTENHPGRSTSERAFVCQVGPDKKENLRRDRLADAGNLPRFL